MGTSIVDKILIVQIMISTIHVTARLAIITMLRMRGVQTKMSVEMGPTIVIPIKKHVSIQLAVLSVFAKMDGQELKVPALTWMNAGKEHAHAHH